MHSRSACMLLSGPMAAMAPRLEGRPGEHRQIRLQRAQEETPADGVLAAHHEHRCHRPSASFLRFVPRTLGGSPLLGDDRPVSCGHGGRGVPESHSGASSERAAPRTHRRRQADRPDRDTGGHPVVDPSTAIARIRGRPRPAQQCEEQRPKQGSRQDHKVGAAAAEAVHGQAAERRAQGGAPIQTNVQAPM